MGEEPLIVLPSMAGGQLESWRALVELAPALGEHCLLVGGQMVLLHEVERGAVETRPTDDVDVVVDVLAPDNLGRRARLALGGGRTIGVPGATQALDRSEFIRVALADGSTARLRRPTLIGALVGKVLAVHQITSMTSAERMKHVRDADSLVRLLGPLDRHEAQLTPKERTQLQRFAESPDLSALGRRSLEVLLGA